MTVGDDYKILELKERIAELKERVLYNYNKNAELSQIREVLRELIETVNLRGEISQTSADKLLAKLSGISVLEEIKKESPWQIGSGGENLRLESTPQTSAEMRVMEKGKGAPIDSKPPEPNCDICKGLRDCGFSKIRKRDCKQNNYKYYDPREDDFNWIDSRIVVKREDLIRIFELSEFEDLNYPLNEEMKKLKEVYQIE